MLIDHPSTILLIGAALLNGVTVFMFGYDKLAAMLGRQRISERTLLLLSLFGGWPGGFLAQILFRHKIRKVGFRRKFTAAVICSCSVLLFLGYYSNAA